MHNILKETKLFKNFLIIFLLQMQLKASNQKAAEKNHEKDKKQIGVLYYCKEGFTLRMRMQLPNLFISKINTKSSIQMHSNADLNKHQKELELFNLVHFHTIVRNATFQIERVEREYIIFSDYSFQLKTEHA